MFHYPALLDEVDFLYELEVFLVFTVSAKKEDFCVSTGDFRYERFFHSEVVIDYLLDTVMETDYLALK